MTSLNDMRKRRPGDRDRIDRIKVEMDRLSERRSARGESRKDPVGDAGIAQEIQDWSHLRAEATSELLE